MTHCMQTPGNKVKTTLPADGTVGRLLAYQFVDIAHNSQDLVWTTSQLHASQSSMTLAVGSLVLVMDRSWISTMGKHTDAQCDWTVHRLNADATWSVIQTCRWIPRWPGEVAVNHVLAAALASGK